MVRDTLLTSAVLAATAIAHATPQELTWKSYGNTNSPSPPELRWECAGHVFPRIPVEVIRLNSLECVPFGPSFPQVFPDRDGDGVCELAFEVIPWGDFTASPIGLRSPVTGEGTLLRNNTYRRRAFGGEFALSARRLPGLEGELPERLLLGSPENTGFYGYPGSSIEIYDIETDKLVHLLDGSLERPDGFARSFVTDADFDGDGMPDIVAGRSVGKPGFLEIFSGTDYALIRELPCPVAGHWTFPTGHRDSMVSIGDVDGRGCPDLCLHTAEFTDDVVHDFGPRQSLLVIAGEDGEVIAHRDISQASKNDFICTRLLAIHDSLDPRRSRILTRAPLDEHGERIETYRLVLFDPQSLEIRSTMTAAELAEGSTRLRFPQPWTDHDGDGVRDLWITSFGDSMAYRLVSARTMELIGTLSLAPNRSVRIDKFNPIPDIHGDGWGEICIQWDFGRGMLPRYSVIEGSTLTLEAPSESLSSDPSHNLDDPPN